MKKIWEAGLRQASGDFLSTCVDGNNRKSRLRGPAGGVGADRDGRGPLGWPSPLSPFSGADGHSPPRLGQQGSIC